MEAETVSQVRERFKETLLRKPNVVGVGTGYKEIRGRRTTDLCVVALVRVKVPAAALAADELVPARVEGIPTDVVEVGILRALQTRTDRWRPAPGGISIGHFKVTAGTLGTAVRDRASGERLILSNNHVLANSNQANVGDAVLQPGAIDGGSPNSDTLARLERFVEIQFNQEPPTCGIAKLVADLLNGLARLVGSRHRLRVIQENPQAINRVDAAVARPVNPADLLPEILDIGEVQGTLVPTLGMAVRKSGRTTGYTTGQINVIDTTVTVSYGESRTARFEGQFVTTPMSQGGDSGSLLVDGETPRAVGLLFAGSAQATIYNPIQDVLEALQIDL
ncbi:MAG: hypothetical protein ACRDHG_08665 [Anaerolineales bacterium]